MMSCVKVTSEKCSVAFTLPKLLKYGTEIMQQSESNQFAMALSDGNTCPSEELRGMCGNIELEELERVFPFKSALTALLHCSL